MVLPHGAAFITEHLLPDGVAPTATTIMAITTLAPPPDAGGVRLRGTMAVEPPTAPGEAPPRGAAVPVARRDSEAARLRGVAAPVARQDSEAALLRGAAAPVPTMELSVVRAAGVDSGDNRVPIVGGEKPLSFYFKSTLMRGLPQWDYGLKIKTM